MAYSFTLTLPNSGLFVYNSGDFIMKLSCCWKQWFTFLNPFTTITTFCIVFFRQKQNAVDIFRYSLYFFFFSPRLPYVNPPACLVKCHYQGYRVSSSALLPLFSFDFTIVHYLFFPFAPSDWQHTFVPPTILSLLSLSTINHSVTVSLPAVGSPVYDLAKDSLSLSHHLL